MVNESLPRINGSTRCTIVEEREHDSELFARRVTDIPSSMQEYYDYDTRVDGQPVYVGYAPRSLATSSNGWLIAKYTYNNDDSIANKKTAYDSWDNRTGATYA